MTLDWGALAVEAGEGLDRPLPQQGWPVPSGFELTEVRGVPCLAWREEMDRDVAPKVIAKALDRFVQIGDDPRRVLRFARTFGPFSLCEHLLPGTHRRWPREFPFAPWEPCGLMHDLAGDKRVEPISSWFAYSRQARGMLNVASDLAEDRLPSPDGWRDVYAGTLAAQGRKVTPWWKRSPDAEGLAFEGYKLAQVLDDWLRWGDVRPGLEWPLRGGRPRIYIGNTLFGTLAAQLLFAAVNDNGTRFCSCGAVFTPKGKGPTRYCADCRARRLPSALRQRRYRARRVAGSRQDPS